MRAAFSSALAQSTTHADGSMRISALLTPDVAYPLRRALMRVEAELLLADADTLSENGGEERTPDQRLHDALLALARRVADAATPT